MIRSATEKVMTKPSYIIEERLAIHFNARFAIFFAKFWPLQN